MLVIGRGHIGEALLFGNRDVRLLSSRAYFAVNSTTRRSTLDAFDTIVHAAGPAGEVACCEHPAAAFAAHFTLVEHLVDWCIAGSGKHRLILIGTVAPNIGFYGPLKRAAIAYAERRIEYGDLLVIECGQVIGPGAGEDGVIGKFLRAAVEGHRLQIAGDGTQTIRYTPLSNLVDLIGACTRNWPRNSIVSPVSLPVSLQEIARICIQRAYLKFQINNVLFYNSALTAALNYEEPSGQMIPVDSLKKVIESWMPLMRPEPPRENRDPSA